MRSLQRPAALGIWLALLAGAAHAVSPDLKVSTDDLNEAGEHFLEFQLNKASRAGPEAGAPGVPFQFLGEYSYGITDHWQVAVKLPFARPGGSLHSLGVNAELRYVAPHDEQAGPYWGVNFELGRGRERPGEAMTSGGALAPVLGYRTGRWHFTGNAVFGLPFQGESRATTFSAAAKAAYRVAGRNDAGLELFVDAGPLASWHPHHQRSEYLLVAWDGLVGKSAFNLALGRGLTHASDRWILKAIFALEIFK